MSKILHLDASGRQQASNSRKLSSDLVEAIKTEDSQVTYRDLGAGLSFLSETMIDSYFTAEDQRSTEQNQAIELSDTLVRELMNSDILVVGIPIYNFSMPASFKAWCDLVARAGVTFKYTETGPVGLLEGKKAYVIITSGGVQLDGEQDLLTPWLRQFLNFIGIDDIEIIDATNLGRAAEQVLSKARIHIQSLAY